MKFLMVGGNNNGMLERAAQLAKVTQDVLDKPAVYISTLEPEDEKESEAQTEREKICAGYGFRVLRCERNICDAIEDIPSDSVCIIDSVTSLLRNEMLSEAEIDYLATARVTQDLEEFSRHVRSVVYIGHNIFGGSGRRPDARGEYSPERYRREYYRKALAVVERSLAQFCDHVEELSYGKRYRFK